MSNRVILFVVPVLGLLCSATGSQAGMITWTANWSQSTDAVAATGGPMTGGVTFASAPAGIVETGSQTYTIATLTTFTSADSNTGPDTFSSAPYTLKVNLTDLTSNQTNALVFTGSLSGTLTTTTASFTNTFTSPITQSIQIGANEYMVTLTSFLAPGAPTPIGGGSPLQGYFKAQISVAPAGVSIGTTLGTPEPSSLILAGLGTSLVGLLRRRT